MSASQYDLLIEQGASFKIRLRPTSATLNFAGATGRAMIRRKYSDLLPIATFTVTTGNDGSFWMDCELTAAETAAISVDPATNAEKRITKACYDIEIILADTKVYRLMEGIAKISPEATK